MSFPFDCERQHVSFCLNPSAEPGAFQCFLLDIQPVYWLGFCIIIVSEIASCSKKNWPLTKVVVVVFQYPAADNTGQRNIQAYWKT